MNRSELYILFFLLFIISIIAIVVVYNLIKPSKVNMINEQKFQTDLIQKDTIQNNSWIDKISKQNRTFSYPSVIYRVKQ